MTEARQQAETRIVAPADHGDIRYRHPIMASDMWASNTSTIYIYVGIRERYQHESNVGNRDRRLASASEISASDIGIKNRHQVSALSDARYARGYI